jgi:ANTAR domain-containing protein/GAF domain-containing protein
VVEAVEGDLERLAQGPCRTAFAQRAPATIPDLSAEPGWRALTRVGIDDGIHAALSVPVLVGGGPVGTLDIYASTPREWDDTEAAALQAYAGLVASLLAAAVAARVEGGLANQLQGALEHRLVIEQAVEVLVDREGLDAQAAFEWLRTAARSSACEVVEVAGEVVGGAPLPSDRLAQAKAQRHEDVDREVAAHRRDSSCTRARPDVTSGAARLAERRPSVCKRPPRAAGSPMRKLSGTALTSNGRQLGLREWPGHHVASRIFTGQVQPRSRHIPMKRHRFLSHKARRPVRSAGGEGEQADGQEVGGDSGDHQQVEHLVVTEHGGHRVGATQRIHRRPDRVVRERPSLAGGPQGRRRLSAADRCPAVIGGRGSNRTGSRRARGARHGRVAGAV